MKKTNQLYQSTAIKYSGIAIGITGADTQQENPKRKAENWDHMDIDIES